MSEITALLCCGNISESKAAERTLSVLAAISLARTNRLRSSAYAKGERFLALPASYAAGRGTTTLRTCVRRLGAATTRTACSTARGSALCANSLTAQVQAACFGDMPMLSTSSFELFINEHVKITL